MDQTLKTIPSDAADARKWIGRIIMAVILGEAIWSLIVSVMNNLVVPWLGDVMGPSSGVPTSFTQRPYDYPDLFVSVLELAIAGLVAAVLNNFLQRPTAGRLRPVKSTVPTAAFESEPVIPPAAGPHQATMTHGTLPLAPEPVAPAPPVPLVEPATVARPIAVAPPAPPVVKSVATKPLPPAPKAEPAKPQKPKAVYYNIVGEPMPSDED
jgi:hypothetical protein